MLPPANKVSSHHHSRLGNLVILVIWLAILGLAANNRQNIIDWWKLRNYQAPATVSQLAAQDTMTAYGRKIFYVNHAAILNKTAFPKQCPNNGGEQTIVLGCYHGDQAGIFLLGVNDPRLNGVEQVTAAHEMLHGAYDRLSSSEKAKVDAMLLDYYNNDLRDQRLRNTIAAYRKTEPHDVVNEMHSIFGTEVAKLPSGLEQYYKRYFTNRAQMAAYAAQYQGEFTSRQAAVTQDDAQLAALKQQIDSLEADLQVKQSTISSKQSSLNELKASGNTDAYNAGVPGYNTLVNDYNAEVEQVRGLIGQYNTLVAARNAIATQENQLSKELITNPPTISR
ncbi:MAG TPA: hypothetical protein VMU97_00140 [Candidatus Dormibacteraeota bacterium]|nr:hypothetical protein [Candidatus Dormibacteraeota bacterium]